MRTTINIEDALIDNAAELTGIKEKTQLVKLGLEDWGLALTADRRERARHDFLAQRGPASPDEIRQFEDEWALKAFGVNSQNAPSLPRNNRA